MSLVACNGGGSGGGAAAGGEAPAPSLPDDDGTSVLPDPNPNPSPISGLVDHSTRNPAYGSEATQAECEMLADWVIGVDETWYFGPAYAHLGVTQQDADNYNDLNFYRFDEDGVVFRHWNGSAWSNQFINNVTVIELGADCDVEILGSLTGVGRVWWQGVEL